MRHDPVTMRNVWAKKWFTRKRPITVTNSGGALSDYQVKISLTYDANMQADFSDIRFTDANGRPLPHWIETYTASTSATVWVRCLSLPTGDTTIYLYYGGINVANNSNGYRTFPFFADATAWNGTQQEYGLSVPEIVTTPTPDGTGETIHPSVVYFADGWGAGSKKYWMAVTPYDNADITLENPCILCSDDGIDWEIPSGLTNPLVGPRASGHYADPELCYNDETGELYLYWYTNIGNTYINVARSSDGVTWLTMGGVDVSTMTDGEIVADAILGPFIDASGDEEQSPCVVKTGASEWHYWAGRGNGMVHRTSTDGVTWSSVTACDIGAAGKNLWHFGIIYSPTLEKFVMISVDDDSYSTEELSVSTDGETWTRYTWPVLRSGSTATSFDRELYRTTLVEIDGYITIWPSTYQNTSGFDTYTSRCDPIAVADLINYVSGTYTKNGSFPRYEVFSETRHGGSVEPSSGDLVLTPPYQSGVGAISYVRPGTYSGSSNIAIRASIQPSTEHYASVGLGERQLCTGGGYGLLLGGLGNGWTYTMFSGSQYLFRRTDTAPTQAATAVAPTVSDDFHVWELQIISGGGVKAFFDNVQQMAIAGQASFISNTKYPFVGQNLSASTSARTTAVDWMLARPVAGTEPTTSVGAEVSDVFQLASGDNLLLVSGDSMQSNNPSNRMRVY